VVFPKKNGEVSGRREVAEGRNEKEEGRGRSFGTAERSWRGVKGRVSGFGRTHHWVWRKIPIFKLKREKERIWE